ncbi:MAG TPA: phage major tail tube protein [Chroococcidiopsis sp.]
MAGSTLIRKFERAAAWLDDGSGRFSSLAGDVNEIELPELSWDVVEHETIALIGTPEFPGRLEAMEMTIKWAGWSDELAAAAADPFNATKLQIRANIAEYRGSSKAGDRSLIYRISGRFKTNTLGTFSPGEMERESMMSVDSITEIYEGETLLEVSISPPVYRVRGRDLLADSRRNLGL